MIEEYSSSEKRLVSWFLKSRNKWKERALKKQKELRKAGIKIRDLEKSREEWKKKAQKYQGKSQQIEEEKKLLEKKGKSKKKKQQKIIVIH